MLVLVGFYGILSRAILLDRIPKHLKSSDVAKVEFEMENEFVGMDINMYLLIPMCICCFMKD